MFYREITKSILRVNIPSIINIIRSTTARKSIKNIIRSTTARKSIKNIIRSTTKRKKKKRKNLTNYYFIP